MKKGVWKLVGVFIISLLFLPVTVNAEVFGGWDSETEANWESELNIQRSTPRHSGRKETTVISGNTAYRARGWTTWAGVYHYTTARMETRWTGSVLTTSGRVWGRNGTEAVSPWFRINSVQTDGVARTYYGR
ncbi:hypothetical protein D920_01423 [Enterococcus faecalis 13-SD-W-01]|nr:hypothetical protein D920_01423 [Enterococcus faecalis 13-SD-W-01]